jgi:hypothetical protein
LGTPLLGMIYNASGMVDTWGWFTLVGPTLRTATAQSRRLWAEMKLRKLANTKLCPPVVNRFVGSIGS